MNVYKLIFIALLLLGLCVSGVQANIPNASTLKYLPFNDSVSDFSQFGDTITNVNTTIDTSVYRYGSGSAYFDNKSYLTFSATNVDLSTQSWTIDVWVNATGGSSNIFTGKTTDIGFAPIAVYVGDESHLWLLYTNKTDGWTNIGTYIRSADLSFNNWHNIVVTRNAVARTIDAWVDGTHIYQWTDVPTTLLDSGTHPPSIGGYYNEGYKYLMKGHIDDFVITNTTGIETTVSDHEYLSNPKASFTADKTSGFAPLTIQFTNTSVGNVANTNHLWSYTNSSSTGGNGTAIYWSTDASPSLTLGNGNWTIAKTATNPFGISTSSIMWVNVTVLKLPNADFSSFNTQGTAPFTTYLYDTSTNLNPGPYTYYWDLGDGNTSTTQNLYYTWNATGTYDVKHSVTDSATTAWKNVTGYVTVGTPTPPVVAPVASFYGGPQTGNVPLTVFFTDVSTNTPTSWNWSFGDGVYSELQNPTHSYNRSGFRTVNLTATNSAGSNITVRSKFVRVS